MIRAALWYFTIAIVAALAIAAQMDRAARRDPRIAEIVPPPMRSFAQANIARKALATGDTDAALSEAQLLVARRPMPAEHQRLLAQAQLAAGFEDASTLSIQRASRSGWRDPIVQQAMIEIALSAGDEREAARRLAAMWALAGSANELAPYAERVLSSPEARDEMANLLSEKPRWERVFKRMAPRALSEEIVADITRRSASLGSD